MYDHPDWWDDAKCLERGTQIFFGQGTDGNGNIRRARSFCRNCPVIINCLKFSLKRNEKNGIWAGLAPNERLKHVKAIRDGSTLEVEVFTALRNNMSWINPKVARLERI